MILNKVLKADCMELMGGMADESVDLVLTDPPFNANYAGRPNRKTKVFDQFANDNLTPEAHTEFLENAVKEIYRVMKKDSSAYIFVDFRNYHRFYPIMEKYFKVKNCLIWDKESIGMGYCYRFQHEFILYVHKGKGSPLNFEKRNVCDIMKAKRVRPLDHPTRKPIDLLKQLITHSSKEGDIVFDPFAGSFSTAVAAKLLNRNFICCELEDVYVEIGKKRIKSVEENGTDAVAIPLPKE